MIRSSNPAARVPIAPGVVLTSREARILQGLVSGRSLQQIAVSEETQRKNITVAASRAYRKIGCKDRFTVQTRLEELGALERVCRSDPPTAEQIAARLVQELQRTGRHKGVGAILVLPGGAYASVCSIVRPLEENGR